MPPHDTIPIVPAPRRDAMPDVRALVAYLEQDPQPMIVVDPDYRILAANDAYRRQFGVAGVEHVGRHCFQVSHHYDVPCDQAGEHCPMKQALESRGLNRVLHIHHTPRGPEHVDVELRPIFDADGNVIAYVERLTTVRSASAQPSAEGLVGGADAFNAALGALQRVAPSTLPVLLLGESGTGKELFARALHEASDRAMGPFVVVDCSGIAETLFESELFGYEKGAFTGANQRKPGLVETAQGGTLFEIAGVEAVKEAVRAGMGVGFVSAMSLRHQDAALVLRSLAPAPLTRHFSILVPHGGAPSRVAVQFLEMSLAQDLA